MRVRRASIGVGGVGAVVASEHTSVGFHAEGGFQHQPQRSPETPTVGAGFVVASRPAAEGEAGRALIAGLHGAASRVAPALFGDRGWRDEADGASHLPPWVLLCCPDQVGAVGLLASGG